MNRLQTASLLCAGAFLSFAQPTIAKPNTPPIAARQTSGAHVPAFPYHGATFRGFVADSYKDGGGGAPARFFNWFSKAYAQSGVAYPGKPGLSLDATLKAVAADYKQAKTPASRTAIETKSGAWLHAAVKKSIPKFSLDRGFEFRYAETRGERQCFLQGVLVAGLMQQMGMRAGVVMVSKSEKGEATNNGHAVALVKLSDGHDLIVDVSHPDPTVRQQGLFVADNTTHAFRYVAPIYGPQGTSDMILGYQAVGGPKLTPRSVAPLNIAFLRSQFDYYRGERTINGLLAKPTPEGLAREAAYLRRASAECPRNPLAVYMLGRVYLRMGNMDAARKQLLAAQKVYEKAGWLPDGARDALAAVNAAPSRVSMR